MFGYKIIAKIWNEVIISCHQKFTQNRENSAALIKIIFTIIIALYIPFITFMGANLIKEFDDKNKGQISKVQNSLSTLTSADIQEYIINALSLLMKQQGIDENAIEDKGVLKRLNLTKEIADKQITLNMDISRLKHEALIIFVHIISAAGLLQVGIVMAEASHKLQRDYILYTGAVLGIVGMIIVARSYFILVNLSEALLKQ